MASKTIEELTRLMHQFVQEKGWYADDTKRPQTRRNIATSLMLEASEVLEHFQWGDEASDQTALAGELADVALYLLQLASISEIDLSQAILDKLDENKDRTWDDDTATQPIQFKRYPFTHAQLLKGVRDYLDAPYARIQNIKDIQTLTIQPGLYGLGGQTKIRPILLEILFNNRRYQLALALVEGDKPLIKRQDDLYRHLQQNMPLLMPDHIIGGDKWMVLELFQELLEPQSWQVDHYREAVDNLASLHYRFWNLQIDLKYIQGLWRPFDRDFQRTKKQMLKAMETLSSYDLLQDEHIQLVLTALVEHIGTVRQVLKEAPYTLLHGNYWAGNIASPLDGGRQIVSGWQYCTIGPAMLDLVMFQKQTVCHLVPTMAIDAAIERYRVQLTARQNQRIWTDETWQKQYDMALLWVFGMQWLPWLAAMPEHGYAVNHPMMDREWFIPLSKIVRTYFR